MGYIQKVKCNPVSVRTDVSSFPPASLPSSRQAGREPLPSEKAFIRMDRRRSRALFCVFPFCRPGSLSFTQLLFDTKRRSLYRGHDAQGLPFVSPDSVVPLSRPPLPSLSPSTFIPLVACSRRPRSTDSFLPRAPYPSLFPLLLLSPCRAVLFSSVWSSCVCIYRVNRRV